MCLWKTMELKCMTKCYDFIMKLRKKCISNFSHYLQYYLCFYFIIFISPFVFIFICKNFFDIVRKQRLIKRSSKVHKKNMLNFDQLEAFSENYKPIRVWLWIFYKITVSNCCLLTLLPLLQSVKKIVRQIPSPL